MGIACLVFGMLGVCLSWLPVVGWLGVALGAAACALGIPSVLYWYARPGYVAWGVAGILLGIAAISVGLAFQIKHAASSLDVLFRALPTPDAYFVLGAAFVALAAGMLLGRLRFRIPGAIIAGLAITVLAVSGGWALLTADRAMGAAEPSVAAHADQRR